MHPLGDDRPSFRVETTGGVLQGMDGDVRRFFGIPYARPPLGAWRWQLPRAAEPWTGVRPATAFGADCPQVSSWYLRAGRFHEDCLTLNVWAPAGGAGLPVLLWLPGGGFVGGSGADIRTDGSELARQGIVVVTANYRTGMFGFFAHPQLRGEGEGASGNYGLHDQIAALAWVRDNIAAFGGDPDRVTVGGVSAGSACVSLLLLTDASRLFQQVILQSAGALRPLASLEEAEADGAAIDPSLATLRALSTAEIMARGAHYTAKPRNLTRSRSLRPILDGRLIRRQELSAFAAGRFAAKPMLVGSNLDEGSQFVASSNVDSLDGYRAFLARQFGAHAAAAESVYEARSVAEIPAMLAALFGDTQFTYAAFGLARAMAPRSPTWRYLFAFRTPETGADPRHGEEVSYSFGRPARSEGRALRSPHPAADGVAGTMSRAWGSFIRTGDPNGPDLPRWDRCTRDGGPSLRIDGSSAMTGDIRAPQMAFLDRYHAATMI